MTWTTQPPTTPGWYWVKEIHTEDGSINSPIVLNVVISPGGDSLGFWLAMTFYLISEAGSPKWAGPLPLPEEAERND